MVWEAIERITKMETYFDRLLAADDPAAIREDASLRELLEILSRYYESGQWLYDYELDEKGLLPENLKRGVLSQDGLYDLLVRTPESRENAHFLE